MGWLRAGGRRKRIKRALFVFFFKKMLFVKMDSYENKPPYYCLNYILSLWICIVYLCRLPSIFHAVNTALIKQRSRGRMEAKEGRGARWPPHIEHFPVDFVEGFSAPWLNEQRHANEWRTNVIIYQTKSEGLWEMETEGGGEGGESRGPHCWK